MKENPHLEPHISFMSHAVMAFLSNLEMGGGGGGGGDGQEIFLYIKNCWKLMHITPLMQGQLALAIFKINKISNAGTCTPTE